MTALTRITADEATTALGMAAKAGIVNARLYVNDPFLGPCWIGSGGWRLDDAAKLIRSAKAVAWAATSDGYDLYVVDRAGALRRFAAVTS